MRGNPGNLRRAAAAKSAAASARAEAGLREMIRRGDPITFRGLAKTAGVSLDFLYRTPGIRQRVEQLRQQQQGSPPPPPPPADPDEPASVVRTLTAQLAEQRRRHREEIQYLKAALETAHGELLELRRRLGSQWHTSETDHGQCATAGPVADASVSDLAAKTTIPRSLTPDSWHFLK